MDREPFGADYGQAMIFLVSRAFGRPPTVVSPGLLVVLAKPDEVAEFWRP
jgi:hypothetical protein